MTDYKEWDHDTLRAFYDERLEENQRRSDERYQQLQESNRIERETVDKRFEAANRYKETYAEMLGRLSNESIKRVEFDARITSLQEKIEILSKPDLRFFGSFAGVAASAIVGLWVIIGLKIDATNQPVVVALEQAKISNDNRDRSITELRSEFQRQMQATETEQSQRSRDISNLQQVTESGKTDRSQLNERTRAIEARVAASTQADANSQTDRAQLNDRVRTMETNMAMNTADRKSTEASLRAALVEIETQFCGEDSLRNLSHAADMRIMSILWQHSKLGVYPTDNAYYPQMCNRNVRTDGK